MLRTNPAHATGACGVRNAAMMQRLYPATSTCALSRVSSDATVLQYYVELAVRERASLPQMFFSCKNLNVADTLVVFQSYNSDATVLQCYMGLAEGERASLPQCYSHANLIVAGTLV